MEKELRNLCEQIQEDIIAFASSGVDVDTFTQSVIDELCDIVVRNFRGLTSPEESSFDPQSKFYQITDIDFDLSGEREEEFAQIVLKKVWQRRVIGPVSEEEIADHISDNSGWCVSRLKLQGGFPSLDSSRFSDLERVVNPVQSHYL